MSTDELSPKDSLLEFPCDFLIKVIGTNRAGFLNEIKEITHRHFPEIPDSCFVERLSKDGNYLAISITVWVHNKLTLDKIYYELTAHPYAKFVL